MRRPDLGPDRLALLACLAGEVRASGHEILADRLKANGITHVYGISGTPIDETLVACGAAGLRVIGTRHQNAAALAAAAHNYLAGRLAAAVIVSAGPAVTNCATAIKVADDNGWPLLVIGGRRPLGTRGMGAFQELDGARLFESITRHRASVDATPDLAQAVDGACRAAVAGVPGPCYLDVCEEALRGAGVRTSADSATPPTASTAEPDWEPAVAALLSARRPVLIVGSDARWRDPWPLLAQVVEAWGLPFVTTPMARGFLPDSHPLCATAVRSVLLAEADLVLIVGASLDWTLRYGAEIAPDTPVIHLSLRSDRVLAARRGGLEYLGAPAVRLAQLFAAAQARGGMAGADAAWRHTLARRRADTARRLAAAAQDRAAPLTPAAWLGEVARCLPADALTLLDGNVVMAWAQHALTVERPVTRLTPGHNGCMGVGLPFGLAACLACPGRPVLVICGDFALGLHLMELETAVRHRLPLVIMVANNGGPGGSVRQQTYWPADYPERICQFTPGIRHDRIMAALGGEGVRVDAIGQIAPALRRAFASTGPTLIDVDTRDDVGLPML